MARKNGSPNYLAFDFDKEVVVTLTEDRGKLARNGYGEYFARNFSDGRFTCASPDLERKLIDVGARAGSVVAITKEKYGRSAVWNVRLLGSAEPTPISSPTPAKVNGHADVDHAWRDVPHSPIPESKYAPAPNGNTPHTLEDQLKASIAQVQARKPREPKNLLERCAIAAVDAALFVENYAAQQGRPLTVPPESIAAWASTLFINAR